VARASAGSVGFSRRPQCAGFTLDSRKNYTSAQENLSKFNARRLWPFDCNHETGGYMSFSLYLIGFIVLIVGLAVGANMMHMPPRWIGVGVIVMVGLGILTGVTMTRGRDPSN
jgi:hypothetical protein